MEENGFAGGDVKIFKLESCRQLGGAEMEPQRVNEAASIAGIPADELRAHLAIGSLSDKDRKAWSRARRKIISVFTSATLLSLLALSILAALSESAAARQLY